MVRKKEVCFEYWKFLDIILIKKLDVLIKDIRGFWREVK